jgi:hypothetical protein
LLDAGERVVTLTNSADRPNPFGERVKVFPFNFDDPALLEESLRGVTTLYNTYWVRFNYKTFTHATAVTNAQQRWADDTRTSSRGADRQLGKIQALIAECRPELIVGGDL